MAAKKDQKQKQKQLILEQSDTIGYAGAEDDVELLSKCFFYNSAYKIMKNIKERRSILIGGTGAGKTALIEQFYNENSTNCIKISLDEGALSHISTSNIINVLEGLDINLNVIYQTLWKHFLTIQLLKKRTTNYARANRESILGKLKEYLIKNRLQVKVDSYLEQLEREVFLEPRECIQKRSEEMISFLNGALGIPNIISLSAEQKRQLKNDKIEILKIQRAVESPTVDLLHKTHEFLNNEIFTDQQNPFFILIDELDTNWVAKERKYQLIRALIETIKKFKKIENVKIIIGLRTDLYDRIIAATKDEGFQTEKYETYLLPINWQKNELRQLMDKRISEVFKSKYTSQVVDFSNIAPETIDNANCFDYLYNRTFQRPRHIIMFVNECIAKSVGKNKFTQTTIKAAEKEYSNQRLQAIKDEWGESYGLMEQAINFLQKINNSNFQLLSIEQNLITEFASDITETESTSDFDSKLCKYAENAFFEVEQIEKFLAHIFKMLHHIGLVGIKLRPDESYDWYFENYKLLSASNIRNDTSVKVHPMFWRALGINSSAR